nr:putative replication associated protein [Crucivirus sp.]
MYTKIAAMPPKRVDQRVRAPKVIHWTFRKSANEEILTDEERNNEATILYGILLEYCESFAFQLESAPTTGYLHFQGCFALVNRNRHTWIQSNLTHFEYIAPSKGRPKQNWAYATKEDTRVMGPWTWGECAELTKAKDTTYQEALAASTVREGLEIIKTNKPRDFCLYGSTIERNLASAHKKPFVHTYTLADFNREPLVFTKTSHVYGPSNTGKTSFVKAHFQNPLMVSHMDTLKKLSPDNDCIIFDDMSFAHLHPEAVIHLVDQDDDRDIHVRYATAHIPAHTPKVFTHNTRDIFYKADIQEQQRIAIDRRVEYFHVPNKLFGAQAIVMDQEMDDEENPGWTVVEI